MFSLCLHKLLLLLFSIFLSFRKPVPQFHRIDSEVARRASPHEHRQVHGPLRLFIHLNQLRLVLLNRKNHVRHQFRLFPHVHIRIPLLLHRLDHSVHRRRQFLGDALRELRQRLDRAAIARVRELLHRLIHHAVESLQQQQQALPRGHVQLALHEQPRGPGELQQRVAEVRRGFFPGGVEGRDEMADALLLELVLDGVHLVTGDHERERPEERLQRVGERDGDIRRIGIGDGREVRAVDLNR